LLYYWNTIPSLPPGVTPQSGEDETYKAMAALAGAITTLGTAVFGVLGNFNEYRQKRLAIQKAELDIEKQRRELDAR
jgi:hypothetical protein